MTLAARGNATAGSIISKSLKRKIEATSTEKSYEEADVDVDRLRRRSACAAVVRPAGVRPGAGEPGDVVFGAHRKACEEAEEKEGEEVGGFR
ncbi:hypothetical protein [Paraburkholderia sp. J76]|uniref:hypothetical protein n=1 Tax=Paraburkholderia sp. J76 TaxID=2805439 RepID=UPI002ABD31AA|nr:hypothetical protein [Paraburkholderia sp. J76]